MNITKKNNVHFPLQPQWSSSLFLELYLLPLKTPRHNTTNKYKTVKGGNKNRDCLGTLGLEEYHGSGSLGFPHCIQRAGENSNAEPQIGKDKNKQANNLQAGSFPEGTSQNKKPILEIPSLPNTNRTFSLRVSGRMNRLLIFHPTPSTKTED